jgi:hypothetical protein
MMGKKQTLVILFVLGLVVSCKSIKSTNQTIANNQITVDLTECGSYEVKNNQTTIGYAVKPFVVEVDRVKELTEFEQKLKTKYKDKFKKDYRVYSFTKDRAGDTILNTIFLASRHTKNIPNWECELQEVDIYWPKNSSEWVTYNCSKNRFKVLGDPD